MIICRYCDSRIGDDQRYADGDEDGYICSGCGIFISKENYLSIMRLYQNKKKNENESDFRNKIDSIWEKNLEMDL